mmetsp:Transcript_20147/g.55891  ORF Transcript_20147/g.55891 Transcript_20147/m.55891 type:complete len:95 (+) Transcript_20147:262-546(+)
MSRLILNHSTFVEGLLPKLRRLAAEMQQGNIVPGVISVTRGRTEGLTLRLAANQEAEGVYKLVCRKGKTVQEVRLVTRLPREKVLEALERTTAQ